MTDEGKDDSIPLWKKYIAKKDPVLLLDFLCHFNKKYQSCINKKSQNWNDKPTEGPHLFSLHENILQEIEKWLKECSTACDFGPTSTALERAEVLVDSLSIICRNFDNIPFVSSCDVICYTITIASVVVQQLSADYVTEKANVPKEKCVSFLLSALYFMECLYDPYFTWRTWCAKKFLNETYTFPPAVLHVEVVPFFYDCFQRTHCMLPPEVQSHLLHLFGAIISGAQHNALVAITPATLEVLYKVLSDVCVCPEAKYNAVCCIVQTLSTLSKCNVEERQVEVSAVLEGLMKTLLDMCTSSGSEHMYSASVHILDALCSLLSDKNDIIIQKLFRDEGYCLVLLQLLENMKIENHNKEKVAAAILQTLTAFTYRGIKTKKHFESAIGIEKLFSIIRSSVEPTHCVLESIIMFACGSVSSPKSIHYPELAVRIISWLPDITDWEVQTWPVTQLAHFCNRDFRSKVNCCHAGVVRAVLQVLKQDKKLFGKTVGQLLKLFRILASHSISSSELKCLYLLLCPDEDGKQFAYLLPLLHVLSQVSRRAGKIGVTDFIDVENSYHGISVGSIQKWPGTGFSFHAWFLLDKEIQYKATETVPHRRLLYCFINSYGGGFEAFFNEDSQFVIASRTKKEYHAAVVKDCSLDDGRWHCVEVCHLPARRPFSQSSVSVYIDQSLQLTAHLKFPSVSEPFTYCRIGVGGQCPSLQSCSLTDMAGSDMYDPLGTLASLGNAAVGQLSAFIDKDRLMSLAPHLTLPHALKGALQSTPDPAVQTCPLGAQDGVWGIPDSLHGQLASVCVFSETLQSAQVKALQTTGANSLTLFKTEEGSENDLSMKLVLYYDAKATAKCDCLDLAPFHLCPGQLSGSHHSIHDIKNVINTIGGTQVLYPLIENAGKVTNSMASDFAGFSPSSDSNSSVVDETEDWVVVDNSESGHWYVSENQIAACLLLLSDMLHGHPDNQEQLLGKQGISIVGALMQRVPAYLIDVNVLMSVEQLCKDIEASGNINLLSAVQQYIVFEFKIWSRGNFAVRIGHIQYVTTVIKGDRKRYRKKYGVQCLLDVMRTFYSDCDLLSNEDVKTVRMSLLGLVKFYISRDVNIEEISAIIGFLITCSEEEMIIETLDILLAVLESPLAKDQLFLLLYEPGNVEILYCLLVNPDFSQILKVKLLKIIGNLLKSDKVYEKSKIRLRLHDVGFSCLTSLLPAHQVSEEMVTLLIEQALMTDTAPSYQGALALLSFMRNMCVDVKIEAASKLSEVFGRRPTAFQSVTKHIGWQECILGLLVKHPITGCAASFPHLPGLDLIDLSAELDAQDGRSYDTESRTDSPRLGSAALRRLSHFSSLSQLSLEEGLPRTPQLLMQLKEHIFDFDLPQLLNRSKSGSRSSSSEELDASQSEERGTSPPPPSEPEAISTSSVIEEQKEPEDREQVLCELVCHMAYLLMWKGIEGSGKQVWSERGQVLACINMLALSNELFCSHLEGKRKILEKMLHACLTDLQEAGQANAILTENAMEVMKLVYDIVVLENIKDDRCLSEQLLEGVLSLLDVLLVFEESPVEEGWPEMGHMGLDILIVCANSKNLELCAMATARLHALVQIRPFASLDETCHLLAEVDDIIAATIEMGDQEHYSFLIPVVRALLEKVALPLHIHRHLHALPQTSSGPIFFEEFQQYALSPEWKAFVEKTVKPRQQKYKMSFEKDMKEAMNTFWNQCYEATMVAMHKRNREVGESKLRFQSQILEVFQMKVNAEQARYQTLQTASRHQNLFIRRRWKMAKLYLQGSRGPWRKRNGTFHNWKLSHHENFSRMRLKLILNHNFDSHKNASLLRDNQVSSNQPRFGSLPPVALEARVSQQQEDSLAEEDFQTMSITEMEGPDPSGKEKSILSEDCELVTLMSVVKGRFEVTTTHMYFFDLSPIKEEGERHDFKCSLLHLREVHLRRYNLRRSALEFFLIDQTNFFLNFSTKKRNKIYSRIVTLKPANLFYSHAIRSPAELLKASGLTQKWIQRDISNFDYLMQLNTIAGRTYNDLSQYPVFPWILADYTSPELDLENPSVYRDLSKPVGVVNPKNIPEVKAKYENFVDITGTVEKFHYGTHYSNSAGVVHYLVRMEPFTSLHIELQSGRFDVADRQFHSLEATWKMLMDNPNDVKELIPEFFYLPEFLMNLNEFDLGKLQISKERIEDVKLPGWAKSAEDFIYKHRKALESDYVSEHLHEWIDLIFGYKQKGSAAIEALNVFYYVSYEGAVDLDAIEDPLERDATEGMINNFGQTPCQLLKEPHPKRMTLAEATEKMIKADKPPNLFLFLNNLKAFFVEASTSSSPIVFITVPKSPARSFIQHGMLETLVTVSQSGVVGVHGWLPYDRTRTIPNYFTFDRDITLSNNKTTRRLAGPFHPGLEISSRLFVITSDAKLIISGGHWDNSLQVHSLSKCKLMSHVIQHHDIITCLSLDHTSSHLITGSRDTTCMIWELSMQGGTGPILSSKPQQILYGHDDEVTCVAIATDLDMAISSSMDGTVNIHTVRDGYFIRTLRPPCDTLVQQAVTLVSLSQMGYLCVHCEPDDGQVPCSLHLYSINGKHLCQRDVSSSISGMCIAGDYLVTGAVDGMLTIHETFGLRVATSLSLHIPVLAVNITPGNTHVLASLQDGKLIVIGMSTSSLC